MKVSGFINTRSVKVVAKKGIVAWEGDRMQFEFESAEAVQK